MRNDLSEFILDELQWIQNQISSLQREVQTKQPLPGQGSTTILIMRDNKHILSRSDRYTLARVKFLNKGPYKNRIILADIMYRIQAGEITGEAADEVQKVINEYCTFKEAGAAGGVGGASGGYIPATPTDEDMQF